DLQRRLNCEACMNAGGPGSVSQPAFALGYLRGASDATTNKGLPQSLTGQREAASLHDEASANRMHLAIPATTAEALRSRMWRSSPSRGCSPRLHSENQRRQAREGA